MKVDYILNISLVILFIGIISLFIIMEFIDTTKEEEPLFKGSVNGITKYNDTSYVYVKHTVISKVLVKDDSILDVKKGDNIIVFGEEAGGIVIAKKIVMEE